MNSWTGKCHRRLEKRDGKRMGKKRDHVAQKKGEATPQPGHAQNNLVRAPSETNVGSPARLPEKKTGQERAGPDGPREQTTSNRAFKGCFLTREQAKKKKRTKSATRKKRQCGQSWKQAQLFTRRIRASKGHTRRAPWATATGST